jgi:hypothetical protein
MKNLMVGILTVLLVISCVYAKAEMGGREYCSNIAVMIQLRGLDLQDEGKLNGSLTERTKTLTDSLVESSNLTGVTKYQYQDSMEFYVKSWLEGVDRGLEKPYTEPFRECARMYRGRW